MKKENIVAIIKETLQEVGLEPDNLIELGDCEWLYSIPDEESEEYYDSIERILPDDFSVEWTGNLDMISVGCITEDVKITFNNNF